ncbi:MAG: hypothetical protein ACU83V_13705 [Gammaproteobacteria bacterium]
MHYKQTGIAIKAGDNVVIEGNVKGIVVCDYDQQECLPGYEDWLTKETLIGGGTLSKGVMVKTNELGFIHYPDEDDDICFENK